VETYFVPEQFQQLLDSVGPRDLVEIGVLMAVMYALLRLLGKVRGPGVVRILGLAVVGLVLGAQLVIGAFELTVLANVLEYLMTTGLVAVLIIFQPELRRGVMVLGRYRMLRYLGRDGDPVADPLADAAEALSRECVGALIAVERELSLAPYAETGERIDAELSAALLRTLFSPRSPLHDGAVIVSGRRIAAAACQLPLSQPPPGAGGHVGMRHRAALCLCEETDAILLVVSEETGRISLGVGGRLEPVARENLSRRLAGLLSAAPARAAAKQAA
jgi:diadenylate cyclase